jgi:ATP-dependent Clp protease adapter protein ClpS
MVKAKKYKYTIILHNDSVNEYAYVIEVLRSVVGMELTQAENAANLAQKLGKYAIKSTNNKEEADAYVDMLIQHDLDVELQM